MPGIHLHAWGIEDEDYQKSGWLIRRIHSLELVCCSNTTTKLNGYDSKSQES